MLDRTLSVENAMRALEKFMTSLPPLPPPLVLYTRRAKGRLLVERQAQTKRAHSDFSICKINRSDRTAGDK